MIDMKEYYLKSLKMIKVLNIRTIKEYNKLLESYLILNVESLKYISQTRKFSEIVKLVKEVIQASFHHLKSGFSCENNINTYYDSLKVSSKKIYEGGS